MTTRDEIAAARAMALAERKANERYNLGWKHDSSSLYSDYLRSKREVEVARDDQVSVEAMEITTIFLRHLFRGHDTITWVGDGEGLTDLTKSAVIIESALSPMQRDDDLSKPALIVNAGPATIPEYVVGSIKHKGFSDGTETMTGLAAGTVQIMISAALPAQSLNLANFVAKAIRAHWRYLCSQRWFAVTEVAIGGYDPNNPLYNQSISSRERVAVTPLTFTFFHQWMTRSGPRPDAVRLAGLMANAYGVDVNEVMGVVDITDVKSSLVVYAGDQIPEDE